MRQPEEHKAERGSADSWQSVRLVFENRNLHSGWSLGVWSYVDDVRVVDAEPLPDPPGPFRNYLPFMMHSTCDAVPAGLGHQTAARPAQP